MIANSRFHCWRHAQRLMNPAEVIMHVVKQLTQRGDCSPLVRVKDANATELFVAVKVILPANKNSIAERQRDLAAIPEGSAAE
jgi:hypothetical protein